MSDTGDNITRQLQDNLRIAYKDCQTELRRKGVEHLLCVVYGRPTELTSLLLERGMTPAAVERLRYGGMALLTGAAINCIESRVKSGSGGERRFRILQRYFGLDGNMPARLSSMATRYGISRERVRQIKDRAIAILRYEESRRQLEQLLVSCCLAQQPSAVTNPLTMSRSSTRASLELRSHRELLLVDDPWTLATGEQREALKAIATCNRVVVDGCAASGKTWLAIATARKLAQAGKRTLLTCFNRGAADHLQSLCARIDGLTVATFHALCLRLGREAGIDIPGGWNNRVWLERFPDVLMRAMLLDPELRFDAIIVDDAHEMRSNWWQSLEGSLTLRKEGGLFCFYDQRLLSRSVSMPAADRKIDLTGNLRTPASCAALISGAVGSAGTTRFLREHEMMPEFFACQSADAVRRTVSYLITELSDREGYSPSDIVVLTPGLAKYSSVAKLRLPGRARLVKSQSQIENHATLSRIQTFQGLERRVSILVDLNEKVCAMPDHELNRLLYMGCSRFTERLFLLGSDDALARLRELNPQIVAPHLNMISRNVAGPPRR